MKANKVAEKVAMGDGKVSSEAAYASLNGSPGADGGFCRHQTNAEMPPNIPAPEKSKMYRVKGKFGSV